MRFVVKGKGLFCIIESLFRIKIANEMAINLLWSQGCFCSIYVCFVIGVVPFLIYRVSG